MMAKRKRGDVDSSLDKTNGILLARRKDNNVVSVASTRYGVAPVGTVKRYSVKEKRNLQVSRPYMISKYNASMGGTDVMDENIARWRISLRGKKWWWCLFTWLIDASILNAWVLHKKSGNILTQLEFRREIVKAYLNKYRNPPTSSGRPSTSKSSRSFNRVSDDVLYDNIGHMLMPKKSGVMVTNANQLCVQNVLNAMWGCVCHVMLGIIRSCSYELAINKYNN
ncbi:Transposase IS4 [Popillia japonica]|uniref:Transposase IS4 n=1 Tax=Popillia japonica TaxID=7064 RepID=A0AAW1L6L4_POPJA